LWSVDDLRGLCIGDFPIGRRLARDVGKFVAQHVRDLVAPLSGRRGSKY
jgi:hypothetical protein